MQPESLTELVNSGSATIVEEAWMKLVESPDLTPSSLAEYAGVLSALVKAGRKPLAETLAWAAVEAVSSRQEAADALCVARPFLLKVGESEELRKQATELYRTVYAESDGLEGLLEEAGIAGGRPVRRAIRTLDVCLAISDGAYLGGRHEGDAARVDTVDRSAWEITICSADGTQTLGAVHLADDYELVDASDFRVMRHFALDALLKRLAKEPAEVVIEICRQAGGKIDSDVLEEMLVPDVFNAAEFKKWWTRARTALRRSRNVLMEGRLPCYITYVVASGTADDELLAGFEKLYDPAAQLGDIETYIRNCKGRKEEPSAETLQACYDQFSERAEQEAREVPATLLWLCAARVGTLAEIEGACTKTIAHIRQVSDLPGALGGIKEDALLDLSCQCLVEARPDDWQETLLTLLPLFPLAACDRAATRLIKAGRGPADFAPVVEQIFGSPLKHFENMLWLWNGPSGGEKITDMPSLKVLTRVLQTLDECRRRDDLPKEQQRRVNSRARAVLAARKGERFAACIETIEPEMSIALRTLIQRLDNLGRVVRDDLVRILNRKFPVAVKRSTKKPWEREDVLYVTEEGMSRKSKEIAHHIDVKIRDNARAIGEAAEKGDLSENSEYKFALEERDLLRARLAQMNAEMSKARVIELDDVPTDHIGIGSRAVFQRVGDGERYLMVFLGPWESDLTIGRYNYLAPLSLKVMGMKLGDTVEFDHSSASGTYALVELTNELA